MSEKQKLIQTLVDDFVASYPESNHATRTTLGRMLHGFNVDQLTLLVSQLGTPAASETDEPTSSSLKD